MECQNPFLAMNKKMEKIPVPCGKCPSCVARRASQWSFRLLQEEKRSNSAHFITLTYDADHVPISNKKFMSLKKVDLQNFFKRLRKASNENGQSIKYYAVGEYGGKTHRPHYHIILFNADITKIQLAWSLDGKYIGDVHYGQVEGASVGYTLKYISKPKKVPAHKNDDREPEFALMSKRLGENYITEQMTEWHKKDLRERMYCNLLDGKKIAMPRYYKEKIYTEQERKIVGAYMVRTSEKRKAEEMSKIVDFDLWHYEQEQNKIASFKKMLKNSTKNEII